MKSKIFSEKVIERALNTVEKTVKEYDATNVVSNGKCWELNSDKIIDLRLP